MPLKDLIRGLVQTVMSPKFLSVAVVNNFVVSIPICSHFVRLVRVTWVEIHHKKQVSLFKDNNFVLFI